MILLVLIALLYILFVKSLLFDLLAKITSRDISTQYTIPVGIIILYTTTTTMRLRVFKMQQVFGVLPGIGNIDINLIFTFLRLVFFISLLNCFLFI